MQFGSFIYFRLRSFFFGGVFRDLSHECEEWGRKACERGLLKGDDYRDGWF